MVGVAVGVSVGVSVGVAVGVSVGVSVGVAVAVSVGVAVRVAVEVVVGVSVAVAVLVTVGVAVASTVAVKVSVTSRVGVGEAPVPPISARTAGIKALIRLASAVERPSARSAVTRKAATLPTNRIVAMIVTRETDRFGMDIQFPFYLFIRPPAGRNIITIFSAPNPRVWSLLMNRPATRLRSSRIESRYLCRKIGL